MKNILIAVGTISFFIVMIDGLISICKLIKRKVMKQQNDKQRGQLSVEFRKDLESNIESIHIGKYLEFGSVDLTLEEAEALIDLLEKNRNTFAKK